jgi:hypothetical protein
MKVFWTTGARSDHPESEFIEAWNNIADSFARHSVKAKSIRTRKKDSPLWPFAFGGLGLALFMNDLGLYAGFRFICDFEAVPAVGASMLGLNAIASLGPYAVDAIRKGRAYDKRETERDQLRRVLLDSQMLRGAHIL